MILIIEQLLNKVNNLIIELLLFVFIVDNSCAERSNILEALLHLVALL